MIGCGTTTFTAPDDYPGSMPEAAIDLVLTSSERFQDRVTWVKLRRLGLARLEESAQRIDSACAGAAVRVVRARPGIATDVEWAAHAARRDGVARSRRALPSAHDGPVPLGHGLVGAARLRKVQPRAVG